MNNIGELKYNGLSTEPTEPTEPAAESVTGSALKIKSISDIKGSQLKITFENPITIAQAGEYDFTILSSEIGGYQLIIWFRDVINIYISFYFLIAYGVFSQIELQTCRSTYI